MFGGRARLRGCACAITPRGRAAVAEHGMKNGICRIVLNGAKAVDTQIETWDSVFDLGKELLNKGQYEDAARAFDRANTIDPNSPWSRYFLGEALSKLERWEEAAQGCEQAADRGPDR